MTDLSGSDLAAAMIAEAAGGEKKASKFSLKSILPVAILTVVAIAGGTGVGILLSGNRAAAPEAPVAHAPAEAEAVDEAQAAAARASQDDPIVLVPLKTTMTEIASPPKTRVRLDASILIHSKDVEAPDVLAAEIQADTLAFLRTIDLVQIEGARGLLHLREDLRERAKLRSPAVVDYLVQSLVAE
ncbi:flagellar basal body-associated FliL family protein [Aurantimonas sp. Leaf443]|uniref:flagellar basal body-associated FliL family protein n=1 Tax=Aurantimonas sp. Leaf443 TaxID=1736378 RepID=UPI0006FAE732|nr:flagellar basal body-associated FliL family protein [Aurantimonas sp. Leaf443]KQT86018.1 hypothetical protein ASG48_05370 [Aurantimonas sp. Leaf443]